MVVAEPSPTSRDPIDQALAAEVADPAPDSPARTLLINQNRLVRMQIASERWGVALKALTAAAGLLIAGAAAWLAWDASRADGLVIEAFSVPPGFAADGLTGEVVAAQLQDELSSLQARVESTRAAETFANDWGGDIQVEIPQTGVSVGELRAALRERLGDETRITGAVVHTPQGLRLTARVQGQPGDRVTGPELDAVIALAAERLLQRTQPYRYAVHLRQSGRVEEARAVLTALSESGPATERAWALTGLANIAPDVRQQAALGRRALALQPDHGLALWSLGVAQTALGQDEAALLTARRTVRVLERPGYGGMRSKQAAQGALVSRARIAEARGDFGEGVAWAERYAEPPHFFGSDLEGGAAAATMLARRHEPGAARRRMAALAPTDATASRRMSRYGGSTAAYALADMDVEDWPAALQQLDALEAEVATDPRSAGVRGAFTWVRALRAQALARVARTAEAQALIATTERDCHPCLRARGIVARLAGDHADADRWFAEAVRQGPSLPFAYAEWGEAKLARGDLDGAIRLFREAQRRGPRWADPLKFEGDALARRGDHSAAVLRYALAAERAPRWGALHLAWDRSLQALGRAGEARARLERAAEMDLSAEDRAEVERRLGGA